MLPYSLEGFTEAVQDTFKIAIAAAASAGCECKIAKTEVDITRTTEKAAPAGTRRRLHAASITVDVSIVVPDAKTGSLLVQSDAVSREAMNDELVKRGLEPITQVTSSPALKSQDEHASASDSGDAASAGGASGGAAVVAGITVPVAVIMLACAGWYLFRRRSKPQDDPGHAPESEHSGPTFGSRPDTFYHATSEENALAIQERGFVIPAGNGGLLGRGVYCTSTLAKAMDYLKGPHGGVILELKIDLGNCKQLVENDPMMKTWQNKYDSAWAPFSAVNPGDKGKEENCVKDPKRIKVVAAIAGNTGRLKQGGFVIENGKLRKVKGAW